MKISGDWSRLVARHSAAVEEFLHRCRAIPPDRWDQPLATGKWSPAEITSHLIESYRILLAELAGGPGMQLRLSGFQRWMLRHTLFRQILSSGRFPAGARAPRETRPHDIQIEPGAALRTLSTQADRFVQELTDRARTGRVRLTHAYFGPMSARQALLLVIVHTRHHAQQLTTAV
jgi:uncharacterized damage-inducible protein DinB